MPAKERHNDARESILAPVNSVKWLKSQMQGFKSYQDITPQNCEYWALGDLLVPEGQQQIWHFSTTIKVHMIIFIPNDNCNDFLESDS